ncbi:unnamed protein product, partial [Prorocentrum cordatum]
AARGRSGGGARGARGRAAVAPRGLRAARVEEGQLPRHREREGAQLHGRPGAGRYDGHPGGAPGDPGYRGRRRGHEDPALVGRPGAGRADKQGAANREDGLEGLARQGLHSIWYPVRLRARQ